MLHPRIDLFFLHYTGLRSLQATLVTHVFQAFKEWWQRKERDLDTELARIERTSQHFRELTSPEGTSYPAEFGRLVKSLDFSTVFPLYLALRERLDPASPQQRQPIDDHASYLTRRAVCGWTGKGYNRIFLKLVEIVMSAEQPERALRDHLSKLGGPSQAWASDEDFSRSWTNREVYK